MSPRYSIKTARAGRIMMLCLVHHADAVGSDVDSQRPLSARGRAQAEHLANHVKAAGFVPAAIWHSGKLRARQTAEAFYRVCSPFAEFKMIRGLRSEDPPGPMRDIVNAEPSDVLLVSHMPLIAELLQLLCSECEQFPLHGLVALERDGDTWREMWRESAN